METVHTANDFSRSHRKEPRGRGSWAFKLEVEANGTVTQVESVWFAPGQLTLTAARKAAKAYVLAQVPAGVQVTAVFTDTLS